MGNQRAEGAAGRFYLSIAATCDGIMMPKSTGGGGVIAKTYIPRFCLVVAELSCLCLA